MHLHSLPPPVLYLQENGISRLELLRPLSRRLMDGVFTGAAALFWDVILLINMSASARLESSITQ